MPGQKPQVANGEPVPPLRQDERKWLHHLHKYLYESLLPYYADEIAGLPQ